MEEIELDPFLVQAQENRLVVKVGLNAIDGLGAIGSQTTSGGIRDGLLIVQRAIGIVSQGCGVWWQHWDCGISWGIAESTRRCGSSREWTV
jgi:hypothetical protein